ncbi:MAG TPA: hypothetical protein VN952_00080 [Chthoniobacterales bacterium]|nr:hypothetical protein [Chthoniobacterales bacterium]
MPATPRASTSITVAGIFAILAGACVALLSVAMLILFSSARFAKSSLFPAFMLPVLIFFWTFLLLCGLFLSVVGIQVIRLRNWARISLLVIAGLMLFFGVMGIAVIFVTLFVSTPADPRVSRGLLAAILALIYGIPTATSLCWLILFTRSSVVAQFHDFAALQPPRAPSTMAVFNNPECPLAVRIIGWYLGSFILVIPFIPFLPSSVPAMYFGKVFFGLAALGVYAFNFALISIPGIGLLLLKRWSYPLTIASQLLASVNAIFTTSSPSYEASVRAVFEKMNIPNFPSNTEQLLHYSRYFNLIGLLIPIAIVVTLFIARGKFYEAANRASQRSASSPPEPLN